MITYTESQKSCNRLAMEAMQWELYTGEVWYISGHDHMAIMLKEKWCPDQSLDQAMMCAEKLEIWVYISRRGEDAVYASVSPSLHVFYVSGNCATPALAVCAAILKYLDVKKERNQDAEVQTERFAIRNQFSEFAG